jgi:hypothetical protein
VTPDAGGASGAAGAAGAADAVSVAGVATSKGPAGPDGTTSSSQGGDQKGTPISRSIAIRRRSKGIGRFLSATVLPGQAGLRIGSGARRRRGAHGALAWLARRRRRWVTIDRRRFDRATHQHRILAP